MAIFQIPILRPIQPIHLYRHLLREATYLPPVCHSFAVGRIKTLFRKHRKPKSDTKRRILKGHRYLLRLRAANAGDTRRLRTILYHTFGRLGIRRRQLLGPLLQPDAPIGSEALEAELQDQNKEQSDLKIGQNADRRGAKQTISQRKIAYIDKWDLGKLKKFAHSQMSHESTSSSLWPRSRITNLNPMNTIGTTNAFGKTLRGSIIKKRLAKWWARTVDKILPPLAKAEWELLRELAYGGVTDQWEMPARRPVAKSLEEDGTKEEWSWMPYASAPIRKVERNRSRPFRFLSGEVDEGPYARYTKAERPYSKLRMRRIYGQLWETTSYIDRNPETLKSKIIWGKVAKGYGTASPSQAKVFEGVDTAGELFQNPKPETKEPT